MSRILIFGLPSALAVGTLAFAAASDPLPPDTTYRPLPSLPFFEVKAADEAQKPRVMERQRAMLEARYDLSNRPMDGVMMSGGRKPVQEGVRVRVRAELEKQDGAMFDLAYINSQVTDHQKAATLLEWEDRPGSGRRTPAFRRRNPAHRPRTSPCGAGTSGGTVAPRLDRCAAGPYAARREPG